MKSRRFNLVLSRTLAAMIAASGLLCFSRTGHAQGVFATSGSVYVRDSAIALDKLALAQRMQAAGQWNTAADLYQEILEKYPDRVVQTPTNDPNLQRYTSVCEIVRQTICRWPPEGLAVYRGRYEHIAANLLRSAQAGDNVDLPTLQFIFARYFPTDSARAAGLLLMDSDFESGDFADAAHIGQQLLQLHPSLAADRPMVLFRTALAEQFSGDESSAKTVADTLTKDFPQAIGRIRGQDTPLATDLPQELSHVASQQSAVDDSWPLLGGNPARSKIVSQAVSPGARLFSIDLTPAAYLQVKDAALRDQLQKTEETLRQRGSKLGIFPAVDHNQLFFQDNVKLYAVDLDTGAPLSGWAATYPDSNGRFVFGGGATPAPAGEQLFVTVDSRCVVAIMGLPDLTLQLGGISSPLQPILICLDRQTGKELWRADPHDLSGDQSVLQDISLCGSPLIVGDNVYVSGRLGGAQYVNCYVLCYSLTTGKLRWSSYIDSAASNPASDTPSPLAYAGGRIFVSTNLGATACLDAFSGTVLWLNIYSGVNPTDNIDSQSQMGRMDGGDPPMSASPWIYSPPIVQDGNVFILPNDIPQLFICDADTGQLLKRVTLADLLEDPDSSPIPDTLLAATRDQVYLAAANRLFRLAWRQYDHDNNHIPSHSWVSAPIEAYPPPPASAVPLIRGRSFITSASIYVPTLQSISQVRTADGKLDPTNHTFPAGQGHPVGDQHIIAYWDDQHEGPGNVLAVFGHVIVAGDQHIVVYTDLQLAKKRLQNDIDADPDNPLPRLHYAEVMAAAGNTDAAEEKLTEAQQRIGHSADPDAPRRLFEDTLFFAGSPAQDPARAARLFDLADIAARSPEQKALSRLTRAQVALNAGNLPGALQSWQMILSSPALRAAIVTDPPGAVPTGAGSLAEKRTALALLMPDGPGAYLPFDHAAETAFAAASASGDPAQFAAVAAQYPNAHIAREALLSAANSYELAQQPQAALRTLQLLLKKYPDQDRPTILESMARNELNIPGRARLAVWRLELAAAAAPPEAELARPLVLPDGTQLSNLKLSAARDTLQQSLDASELAALPDFHLPAPEKIAAEVRDHNFLSTTIFSVSATATNMTAMPTAAAEFSRSDRVLGWSAKQGLGIFSTHGELLASIPAIDESPQTVAWSRQSLLVATSRFVFVIDPETGAVRGRFDVVALRQTDVPHSSVSPNTPDQILLVQPGTDSTLLATSTNRVVAIDNASAKVLWQSRAAGGSVQQILISDDFVVVCVPLGQSLQMLVLNATTGETISQKTFGAGDNSDPPVNMTLTPDGLLIYTLPASLCVVDLNDADASEQSLQPRAATPNTPDATPIFSVALQSHALVARGGLIFAVANQGNNVRVYSADTAQPWQKPSPDGSIAPVVPSLPPTGGPNVALTLCGDQLLARSTRFLNVISLQHPQNVWTAQQLDDQPQACDSLLIGRDNILVASRLRPPVTATNRETGNFLLACYSRASIQQNPADTQATPLCYFPITGMSGATQLQAIDGGFACFGGGQIRFFRGTRNEP